MHPFELPRRRRFFGLGILGFLILLVVGLVLGGLFWGWLIMLAWALVASTTIGFAKAFWLGVIATVVIGAISGG